LAPEYIPSNLPFREDQIKLIAEVLSPILRGFPTSNLLLYGKTGTGKTATARFVIQRLSAMAKKQKLTAKVGYSNMRLAGTPYRTVLELAHIVGLSLPFTGLSLGEAFQRVLDEIQSSSLFVLFVMDEIDFLVKNSGDQLLYDFTRSRSHIQNGFISLIGISNDLKFKEFLDPRVLSSLSEEEIIFPPYNATQLSAILTERAKQAFKHETVPNSTINLCAALAASEHGDSRRAVDLLRVSGEVAERSNSTTIQEDHVRLALLKIEQDRTVNTVTSLPIQAKLILLASLKTSKSTGDLYVMYSELCRRSGIDILTQRRVSGLINELDLLGLLSTTIVNKGRYGRTKKIAHLIPSEQLNSILSGDPIVGSLL
jgi:cell division control protein 6